MTHNLLSTVFSGDPNVLRVRPGLVITHGEAWATPKQFYQMLMAYYLNNGLYDDFSRLMFEINTWSPAMRPFRNPANRAVEFYVSHLWPGPLPKALPIVADDERIVEAIHQVWQWSNWSTKKQLATRWLALYGDLFIKVASRLPPQTVEGGTRGGRVFFQLTDPQYVTDFDEDERGNLNYLRLDIPIKAGERTLMHTEVWTPIVYQRWEHSFDETTPVSKLGPPLFSVFTQEAYGIDFVPFVHARLRDIGDKRGVGCFTLALDKIDEANVMVTRLHQMLFRHNKVLWALQANATDAAGRPLPAPRVGGGNTGTADSDTLDIGDDRLLRLPGNATLEPLVPQIDYASALAILQDHMLELERDMPELTYWRLREQGGALSGRAIRLMLSDAGDRVTEARGNAETALAQADAMALTMGKSLGLEGFTDLGDFDAGDFEHTFAERDIFPVSEAEVIELIQSKVNSGFAFTTALREAGRSEESIAKILADKQAEMESQQTTLAAALVQAQRQFDQTGGGNGTGA